MQESKTAYRVRCFQILCELGNALMEDGMKGTDEAVTIHSTDLNQHSRGKNRVSLHIHATVRADIAERIKNIMDSSSIPDHIVIDGEVIKPETETGTLIQAEVIEDIQPKRLT